MSALRQLKRSIRERETGERGADRKAKGTTTARTMWQRQQRARRRNAIAKASRRRNRDGK